MAILPQPQEVYGDMKKRYDLNVNKSCPSYTNTQPIFAFTHEYHACEYPCYDINPGYTGKHHIDGSVQDCSISSALAMEILLSCIKLSICSPETGIHISKGPQIEVNHISISHTGISVKLSYLNHISNEDMTLLH